MSGNQYADVIQFNRTVLGLEPNKDFNLTPERLAWFKGVINEELDELEEACGNGSAANRLDALIDLIYFAYGRVFEIGIMPLEFQDCWNKVHRANLAKVVGNKGRGSDCDAIKPAGWESPEDNFNLSCDEPTLPDTASDMAKSMIRAIDETGPANFGALAPNNGGPDYNKGQLDSSLFKDPSKGMKFDNGKLPVGQFLRDFKYAILEVTKIWAFGAQKYAKGNWKFLENGEERYGDAEIRHFLDGDELDPESQILHAAHKAWNALAELSFILKRKNGGKI